MKILRPLIQKHQLRARPGVANAAPRDQCPYSLLGLQRGAPLEEVRAAYLAKIKQVHPDVSVGDTTELASAVNLAYESILKNPSPPTKTNWQGDDEWDDESEATVLFINPFECYNVNPLEWRALQSLIRSREDNPEEALMQSGISFTMSALKYLTPNQMSMVERELEQMEKSLDYEYCQWILNAYLSRSNNWL